MDAARRSLAIGQRKTYASVEKILKPIAGRTKGDGRPSPFFCARALARLPVNLYNSYEAPPQTDEPCYSRRRP
jgi:hypothetical protein